MAREPEAPAVATKVSTSVPTNVATNVAANVATNVASKVATKDKEACDKLGEETFTGILREMLNVLKGELGTDTLTGKKGKPALKQVCLRVQQCLAFPSHVLLTKIDVSGRAFPPGASHEGRV